MTETCPFCEHVMSVPAYIAKDLPDYYWNCEKCEKFFEVENLHRIVWKLTDGMYHTTLVPRYFPTPEPEYRRFDYYD